MKLSRNRKRIRIIHEDCKVPITLVIPVQAGIQAKNVVPVFQDSRFRGNDKAWE